jgi:hypothetical protein
MKVAVRDSTALRALKPLEMAAYLRGMGWRKEADFDGKASLWLRKAQGGEELDVTLPLKQELGDYALRMGELLETLAQAEQRSELEVLRDVMTATADLLRIRTPSDPVENGTLPLEQAVSFVERSRDMMLSAACAALEKRTFYAKRKPQQAMDYLRQVRMGQTEQGSYVLTILSPVSPELKAAQEQVELPGIEPPEPYGRRVIRTLVMALGALDEAARLAAMNGDMAPFTEAVRRGVSANLCDAVVGLAQVSPGAPLDIRVSWSRTRPVVEMPSPRMLLGSDSMPIIEEAARHFREKTPIEDFDVEGFVTGLARGPSAVNGDITVEGIVNDHIQRIIIRLGEDTYSNAVRAHNDRLKVKCTGDLVKEGRGYRLQSPRHFEVIADDEDD